MNFRDLRINSGKSVHQIAKILNIKEETYLKYEYSMRLPSISILTHMKDIFQCSGDELFEAYDYHKEVQLLRYGKTNP